MPRLPDTYAPRPTPQSGRGIASYDGTAVARAVQGLGGVVGEVAQRLDQEEALQEALGARRKMDEWERAARDAAGQLKGADSFGIPDQLAKSFDENANKIGEGITNPRARRAFQEMATSRRGQVMDWAGSHVAKEREVYRQGEYVANVDGFIANAADDPKRAPAELGIMEAEVRNFWKGMSPAEVDKKVSDAKDALHAAVVKRLLINPDTAMEGKAYFDKVSETISPKVRAALSADLKQVTNAIEVGGFTQDLWKTMGPQGPNDEPKLFDMEQATKEKYANDPEKARAAVANLREMTASWDKQQAGRNATNVNSVMEAFNKNTPRARLQLMDEFKALPATEQAKLGEHWDNLAYQRTVRATANDQRAIASADRKQRELEQATGADYLKYSDWSVLSAMSIPEVQALQYKLGERRTEHLLNLRQSLESKESKLAVRQDQDTFNKLADKAGFKPFDPTKTQAQRQELGNLKDAVDQGIAALQKDKKREATYEEKRNVMQDIIDDKVMVDVNWGRDKASPVRMLSAEDLKNAYVMVGDKEVRLSEIPADYITRITRELKNAGLPATQKNIAEAYSKSAAAEARRKAGQSAAGVVNGR